MKFGSKKAIFWVIWGGFEGFEPCLGISHPTHPHLGKISQKKRFFFGSFPNHICTSSTSSNLHMCSIKTIIIMILPHCCSVMWHLKPKKTAQLCGADQVDLFTITIIIVIIPIGMSIIVINRSSVLGISSRIGSVRLCSILS